MHEQNNINCKLRSLQCVFKALVLTFWCVLFSVPVVLSTTPVHVDNWFCEPVMLNIFEINLSSEVPLVCC